MSQAKNLIITSTQRAAFPVEFGVLTDNRDIPKSSPLIKLNPIIDENIIRIGGRLRHAELEIGLDVFGPWNVTARRTRGGHAQSKRWAIMFTCMSTRAVHIEVIETMDTSSCINALRRFFAIRGPPKQLRSDRGTNFIGASKELGLAKEPQEDTVQRFLGEQGCTWEFNPPYSSHMGGAWERMIGVARRILDSMLLQGPSHLSHEVLCTLMAEVTTMINPRPLVSVSADPDFPLILTPAMLLTQKDGRSPAPPGDFNDKDLFRSQWRQVQSLASKFWSRWRNEYLPTLQSRRKWNEARRNLQKGDLVLLKDCQVPRNEWPLALIPSAITGRAAFPVEFGVLTDNRDIPKSSPLIKLNPIIDENIIRIGGRLRHAELEIGLDVFGPWNVTARRTRGGHAQSKRWAIMFTCMSTRAVHIEVIETMDTSSCINALRRFFAIRGPPKQLRSDRGTNFIGASKELGLAKEPQEDTVQRFLGEQGCTWEFNPPYSSHMGGAWERMIGVARRILDSMLLQGPSHLSHEVLCTLMAEVTAMINPRPLVSVSADPDFPLILTPAMLLTQKDGRSPAPPGDFNDKDLFRSQWRQVQSLASKFWSRWRNEYLPTLQSRRKWNEARRNLQKGDLVLLKDCQVPRNEWPLALIPSAITGRYGRYGR
ncbi:hypothetical protein DPEC_G00087820 [Dallia pectoralis]|uniref:Uncharacterized protein n=1 Tax=Dallia pectoralis TaxID=75939 RepID=A0ACC2H100_DALPE|nr:hypothetical protein DPEC_G00087820 [Dallia pectoralis]